MLEGHDVMDCQWCRGDGKDHATLGLRTMRDCPRCAGSGRVYVTSRESVTGRRRVYKGPAPRDIVRGQIFAPAKSAFPPSMAVMAAHQQQELNEVLQRPKRAKTRKKHARRHAA